QLRETQIGAVLYPDEMHHDRNVIHQCAIAQSVLFAVEETVSTYLAKRNIFPNIVAGHSVGEAAAASTCGVLSRAAGCQLVSARGTLYSNWTSRDCKMLAVTSTTDIPIRISNWIEGAIVEKAASNGKQQVVFSGQSTAIGKFNDAIAETSSKAYLMEWSTATHSKYINSVILEFWNTAYALKYEDGVVIPFLSSLSGTLLQKISGEYWCQQSLCKVDFIQVCKNSEGLSQDAALEVGPRPVLLALMGSNESKMSKEMIP
ncbi:MAG: acyltransferase domain-containing protein, partial [Pseudoalteromonas sp.]|nr:acyltransferase domain-containing protein [Pseudoalteromonas sp.]